MANARARARMSAPSDTALFGLMVECEPRAQIQGTVPGTYSAPLTDVWIDDEILECGRFKKGANWTVYKDAAVARGANPAHFVEDATYVRVTNTAVRPFLSLFDVVAVNPFQNGGITPRDIRTIKNLAATAKQATRPMLTTRPPNIVFHGWKDDMPTGPHTSTLWAHYYTAIKDNGFFMQGTGPNTTNGALTVDPDEANAWPGGIVKDIFAGPPTETPFGQVSGHNWHVDYTKPTLPAVMATAALAQHTDYWAAGGALGESIDQYMVHDVCPRYPARSGATNEPVIAPDVWYAATRKIPLAYFDKFRGISATLSRIWTTYGGAWNRVTAGAPQFVDSVGAIFYNYEWSQPLTDSQFASELVEVRRAGIPLGLGNNDVHASHLGMFTTAGHPKWMDYLAAARAAGWAQNVYVASCNEIGYLFWQPGMRPVG